MKLFFVPKDLFSFLSRKARGEKPLKTTHKFVFLQPRSYRIIFPRLSGTLGTSREFVSQAAPHKGAWFRGW